MKTVKTTTPFVLAAIVSAVLMAGCSQAVSDTTENRAVWLHPGMFSSDRDTALMKMKELFSSYREAGINNLFCYFTMKEENGFSWDYLQALIDEGHEQDIKIHPMILPGYPVREVEEVLQHPEWLVVNIEGDTNNYLNPALPEVHDYWLRRVSEAMKYDIDGIHIDYARYAIDQKFSYDSTTISLFRDLHGQSPLDGENNCGSILWCEWIGWNASRMTDLVAKISDLVRSSGRDLAVGVDVFPDNETAQVMIGQDWDEWAAEGRIDLICPMLYTNDTALYRRYLIRALEAAEGRCQVWAGTGLRTSHNVITPEILKAQIAIARQAGAEGIAFFSGYSFTREMSEQLQPPAVQ